MPVKTVTGSSRTPSSADIPPEDRGILAILKSFEEINIVDRASRIVGAPSINEFCRQAILKTGRKVLREGTSSKRFSGVGVGELRLPEREGRLSFDLSISREQMRAINATANREGMLIEEWLACLITKAVSQVA